MTDKEAIFQELYEKYFAPFCIYAKRFIEDTDIRQDIVSDVFAHLWVKADTNILQESVALSYLKTSIRNSCLNYLRHKTFEDEYEQKMEEHIPSYAESPESIYTLDEMYKLLYDGIEQLPDNLRKVYIESFLQEKKESEVAEDLHISTKSVERYRLQIITQLRKELKDYVPALAFLSIMITD